MPESPYPTGVPREVDPEEYHVLLGEGGTLYPGVRIGRPGKSRAYWFTITLMQVLRVRYATRVEGVEHVAPGPAILVGNHVNELDPAMVVISTWWRVSAFTKIAGFEHPAAFFFRFMGQIPLRRGDAASTRWAMRMSQHALTHGGKVGVYPEGTRSPDPEVLHKLHKRILISLLQANPLVPVHVVTIRYGRRRSRWRRIPVAVRVSERVMVDPERMTPQEMTDIIRDTMLALGGQRYVDRYAQDVKAELRARRSGGSAA